MEKNWLIRTQSNHIFGPVSISKIRELIRNKSLKPHDEVCSGNGYWFFIKERELVDRYVFKELSQSFNPISEAVDVDVSDVLKGFTEEGSGVIYPSEIDLEYPEIEHEASNLQARSKRKNYNEEYSKESTSNLEDTIFFNRNELLENKYPDKSELEFPEIDNKKSK